MMTEFFDDLLFGYGDDESVIGESKARHIIDSKIKYIRKKTDGDNRVIYAFLLYMGKSIRVSPTIAIEDCVSAISAMTMEEVMDVVQTHIISLSNQKKKIYSFSVDIFPISFLFFCRDVSPEENFVKNYETTFLTAQFSLN